MTDPNGLILEFTLDHPGRTRSRKTGGPMRTPELKRWMAGDHTSNNTYR